MIYATITGIEQKIRDIYIFPISITQVKWGVIYTPRVYLEHRR